MEPTGQSSIYDKKRPMNPAAAWKQALSCVLVCAAPLWMTGCLKHTRILERPQQPTVVLSASAEQLIQRLDEHYNQINSLSATVLMQATVGGAVKGKVTDYTSVRGYVLLRKPGMLRVLGLLPVVETRAFDMASNGQQFTVLIPPKNEAIVGTKSVSEAAKNPLENLRPAIFYDALLVKDVDPGDLVYVTSNTRLARDPHNKHLIVEPDYDLGILRRQDSSNDLIPVRVVHISRTDLLPYQQDEYDRHGVLVTTTLYSNYQTFQQIEFPTRIVIERPQDQYRITLTIQKLTLNRPLADDQFELKIPSGVQIKHLK